MVKFFHFLFLFCFLLPGIFAQDTIVKYLDKNLTITSRFDDAAFVANIVKNEKGYFARIFYGRENIAIEGTYKDKNLQIRNGMFKFYYASTSRIMSIGDFEYNIPNGIWQRWYENGRKQDSGRKYYDKEVGLWKYWHENGTLKARGKYADSIETPINLTKRISKEEKPQTIADYIASYFGDIKIGLWKTYYENKQMKDSVFFTEGLRDGFATSWFSNGNMECAGLYKNDKEEDRWNWFHSNGEKATEEVYRKGKIQSMACYDTTGTFSGDFCSIDKPAIFKGGLTALETFIKDNIKYPEEARQQKYSAIVAVNFTINPEGSLKKIVILDSPTNYFSREINRVLYLMPLWEPAVYHNRYVDYTFNLKIPFLYPE